jgi:hypothetical protein
MTARAPWRAIGAAGLAVLLGASAHAYALWGASWPSGAIVMHMQLGSSGGTLSDGTGNWNSATEPALADWNVYLSRASFRVVRDSTAPVADRNSYNNVVWADSIYGMPFPSRVLAVTPEWRLGSVMTDADVLFNRAYSWNSYRGRLATNGVIDIRRVALHEFGHVLGLLHPDDYGQFVNAIMNATISNLDVLTADDVAGAIVLYGGTPPPPPSTAPGPPTGLTVATLGSTARLAWSRPTSGGAPTAYSIEAGSNPGLANLANFSTGNTLTSFSASSVGSGVYYVRVRATGAGGTSGPSNEAILTVGNGCAGPPGLPSGLLATAIGTTVILTWSPAAGATSYVVEAGAISGAANLANSDLGSAATSYTAQNVGRGRYYVRMRGKNACGVGGASNEVVLVV